MYWMDLTAEEMKCYNIFLSSRLDTVVLMNYIKRFVVYIYSKNTITAQKRKITE